MKLKIEKPMFIQSFDAVQANAWTSWWLDQIQPINDLLENGVEVYANAGTENLIKTRHSWSGSMLNRNRTHRALLVGIEPIKKWNCPCGAEAMFADTEDCTTPLCYRCANEVAKAVLGESDDDRG